MEKKKELLINVMYYGLITIGLILALKYIVPPLMPFVVAFIMVYLLKRPIKAICRRFALSHKQTKFASIALLLLFYSLIISGLVFLVIAGISSIKSFLDMWPVLYKETIRPLFDVLMSDSFIDNLHLSSELKYAIEVVSTSINESFSTIMSYVSSFIVASASSFITSIPNFFVSVVMCVIASFFIMSDYDKITGYTMNLMNDKIRFYYDEIKSFLINKVLVILKAYLRIMSITFVELFIGFMIIGIDNAFIIALSIAIFDILPVFGTGGIMIPWILISLLSQNYLLAIELLVIYIVVTIIRNIIEPKIVGAELGLHPLVTLGSMLVGVRFFGVLGLFGFPIILSFLVYEFSDKLKYKKLHQ
ncbi:MAG: sporulation integral membrane protein YtvI [Erysipelotrichaceae bacterium]|nr:sporulation integral membrane protein YtvI [Erysipelotrichaceae bacterium]MDY5252107.1 sporulation integral membrane protein YtvI [Erysipelotrichaceae bacterium]